MDEYAPSSPPEDVKEKNADLWYKGLEIFARRATELFVDQPRENQVGHA